VFVFEYLIKCDVANWINLAVSGDELWLFCEQLMNVPKTMTKVLNM
jgi:hypothetical protein